MKFLDEAKISYVYLYFASFCPCAIDSNYECPCLALLLQYNKCIQCFPRDGSHRDNFGKSLETLSAVQSQCEFLSRL